MEREENAGFTAGTPWIEVNSNYVEINAEEEIHDPDSVFSYYRILTHLRKKYPVFIDGRFRLLMEEDSQIFAYTRTSQNEEMLVCANFTGEPAHCPLIGEWKDAQILIHNYEGGLSEEMKPYEAMMLIRKR